MCSSSGGQNCIIQHLVSSHSVGVMIPDAVLYIYTYIYMYCRQPLNLCSRRSPTECDDTRRCIIQFDLLMMST